MNEIKVQTAERLVERGIYPPVLTGPMVVGAERSARLFNDAYDDHARRIGHALGDVGAVRDEINASQSIDAVSKGNTRQ